MSNPGPGDLVMSYLALRRAVGVIAVVLPVVLLVGKQLIDGPGLPGSISAYYYTGMRDVFVGLLVAQGTFLLSYRYDRIDSIVAAVAGLAVIGVALVPTGPITTVSGVVHILFAGLFFLTVAYFSYFLFTRGDGAPTPRKKLRNLVYRAAGVLIVVSIALAVAVDSLLPPDVVAAYVPVFWLESVAVVAFGVSWLIKGETILRDRT